MNKYTITIDEIETMDLDKQLRPLLRDAYWAISNGRKQVARASASDKAQAVEAVGRAREKFSEIVDLWSDYLTTDQLARLRA